MAVGDLGKNNKKLPAYAINFNSIFLISAIFLYVKIFKLFLILNLLFLLLYSALLPLISFFFVCNIGETEVFCFILKTFKRTRLWVGETIVRSQRKSVKVLTFLQLSVIRPTTCWLATKKCAWNAFCLGFRAHHIKKLATM